MLFHKTRNKLIDLAEKTLGEIADEILSLEDKAETLESEKENLEDKVKTLESDLKDALAQADQ